MTEYSIEATIGMIFKTPLFGVTTFFDDKKDSKLLRMIKTLVYLITTVAGFGVFMLLSKIDNRSSALADFGSAMVGKNEIIAMVPLMIVGILFAMLYEFFGDVLCKAFKPLEKHKIIRAIVGGLILGLIGTALPIILFSGEHQLTELADGWRNMSIYLLLAAGVIKLFLTEFCLSAGWCGGHIFPVIFCRGEHRVCSSIDVPDRSGNINCNCNYFTYQRSP